MNREPFGKKCKCNHYESEHNLQKQDFSKPSGIEMGILFTHPPGLIKGPVRTNCKICHCDKFESEKKGWGFYK